MDKHATPSRDIGSPHSSGRLDRGQPHAQFIRLSPKDDERTFERFIRSIRQCNTLSDARRLRTEITAQWKRDSMMTESIDNQWAIYMRRLETGKRLVDQKVATLTVGTESSTRMKRVESESMIAGKLPHAVAASSKIESYTLEDVMKDPAGLMYFMVSPWLLGENCNLADPVSGIHGPPKPDGTRTVLAGCERTSKST